MHSEMEQLKCTIMRGGTSKGIYINNNELPEDFEQKDRVIKAIFGSPDLRQIDGLGGADPVTSKLAIISASSRSDADIDYTFAQVGIDTDVVDYRGNCGNISSGVGPYAIDQGFVEADSPLTTVKINQTNTGKMIIAKVPTVEGKAAVEGDLVIDGVPGSGAKITLDFSDTQGALTGALLPTGNPIDEVEIEGKKYNISLVDAGNPVVFINAEELNLKGTEKPSEIEGNEILMNEIERIRGVAAEKIGFVVKWELAASESPYIPFFAIISPAADYTTYLGQQVKGNSIDVVSRLLFMLKMHKAYPVTGTVCTGAAAMVPGSVVWNALRDEAKQREKIVIGHPAGAIPIETAAEISNEGKINLKKAAIYRTARKIMEGHVFVRKSLFV